MSSKHRVTIVVSVIIAMSVLPPGTVPALAFTENGAGGNNFFGTTPASNTGTDNAFFGSSAGTDNTTGRDNAFFGSAAGLNNETGSDNAFFGREAGNFNDAGSDNAFFGSSAGRANNASSNAFFGQAAGTNNSTGAFNVFVGWRTGQNNTTACCNAFVGSGAGEANTTGAGNAFFGPAAGQLITGGNFDTLLGAWAEGAPGITNATAIGHRAQVSQSNSLVLGSINGVNLGSADTNVGIGTPAPADPLHVRRTDGSAKVLVEEASGTLLGRELFELVNNGAARFRVRNTSNNATWDFQSSSNAGSFVIDRVGGPASLDFEMQPDGDLAVRGSVTGTSFISSSDRNLKTDIAPADARALMAMLRELDISTWRFKNQTKGTVNLGPMAQDFHRLFGMGTDTTIDVRDLAALSLVAAQSLDRRHADLERRVGRLEGSAR